MDKLNEYLQELISTSSYELHLEPNANPYVVSANGNTDVANSPLLGSQISMMVFPLIPSNIKQDLPNQPAVEFVHPSNIGDFSFTVQKSSAGFNVTIKPIAGRSVDADDFSVPEVTETEDLVPVVDTSPPIELQPVDFAAHSYVETPIGQDLETFYLNEQEQVPEYDIQVEGKPLDDLIETFSNSADAGTNTLVIDDLLPAPVYEIPHDEAPAHVDAEDVLNSIVNDRRAGERPLNNADFKTRMEALFYKMHQFGASDLHLSVDMPPMVRKDGKIQKVECDEIVLTTEVMKGLLMSIMPERNREEFSERRDSDFAYEILGLARFRCNIFMDRKGMGGVFRIIPAKMTTAEDLGLPPSILGMCELNKGLVVVTGPTGSGKSTTLCAMVNHINSQREDHIITIEDPIEFVHENQKCLVNQREVHNHTSSFKDALRAALREDPDIILVGEMLRS